MRGLHKPKIFVFQRCVKKCELEKKLIGRTRLRSPPGGRVSRQRENLRVPNKREMDG